MFKQGDDPIDANNKMMSFLLTVITSHFPYTNNQLRNSSNLRQQTTIHDTRVTVQPLMGRQNSYIVGEGYMARQCLKPKRKRDATWFKDKVLLVEAQGKGKVLNEEELEFLADPGVAQAKAVLMANLSSYGSDVLSEIPYSDNTHNDMLNQWKLKGKEITDNAAQVPNATTIALRMYKLALVTLALRDKNNRETHIYYLKHTMKQAAILREIVEQARLLNPLDNGSYSNYKYVKLIQELIGYVRDTCPDIHKPSKKLVAYECMRATSATQKHKKRKEWKPTRKVFNSVGYKWKLTRRTFTLDGNACLLTRLTATSKVPLRFPIPLEVVAPNHIVTRLYTKRPKKVMIYSEDLEELTYTSLSIGDMMASSPIYLLSKATKTKSWLWHRPLSHLNFGAINHLAKQGLVRGLPRLKFKMDHLCSACAMGKSKKQSHKPKSEDTNNEKLYLLHMDLYGPMCVESVSRKKYILVIVDEYSWFTWVKFLESNDEAPDFINKFMKMIQVRLNAAVRNIRTDNGTEFVNQTLRDYYE
nr:ribonuclease H-like domain-containing protein [Tanacetum cinerariifolium]